MLMVKSSDLLLTGASQSSGIRWVFADATDSARSLARGHLAGPAASLALAESIAGVALLGADLEQPEETVSLHLKCSGAIESVLVEAAFDGALRGFTAKKIINELDGDEEPDMSNAFGPLGNVQIMRSIPGKILAQSGFQVPNPRPASIITDFYVGALQRKALATIIAVPGLDGPDRVRGFLVECMPDGDAEAFKAVCAKLSPDSFSDSLEAATGAQALCEEIGLEDSIIDEPRPLFFGCRCSRDRARETLQTIPPDELLQMASSGKDTDIFCHMCGKCYSFKTDDIKKIADSMR